MSTVQPSQPQQQSPDPTKKVGSDGEDFSDTANETGTFEVRVQVLYFFLFYSFKKETKNNNSISSRSSSSNKKKWQINFVQPHVQSNNNDSWTLHFLRQCAVKLDDDTSRIENVAQKEKERT